MKYRTLPGIDKPLSVLTYGTPKAACDASLREEAFRSYMNPGSEIWAKEYWSWHGTSAGPSRVQFIRESDVGLGAIVWGSRRPKPSVDR